MSRKIKVGVIGCGQMGQEHIKCLTLSGKAEIVALSDPYERNLKEALKIFPYVPRIFKSYQELLSLGEIEAVIIATPNYTHKDISISALRAGKHVLCEKPMSITPQDCQEMIRERERSGKILQIGLELRHHNLYRKFYELVKNGEIGKVQLLWCHEFRGPFLKKVNDWILDPRKSGGSLVEKNCHHFDFFNWVIGAKPLKVSALGGEDLVYKGKKMLDNAWVITEYENGARSCLGLSLFSPTDSLRMGAVGENGSIESYENEALRIVVTKAKGKKVYNIEVPPEIKRVGHNGATYNEVVSFLKSVEQNKTPIPALWEAKMSVLLPYIAQKSIEEGRTILLEEEC